MSKKRQRRMIYLRREKAKKTAKYYTAWTVLCLVEAAAAFLLTLLAAAIIVPIASNLRGTPGMGGEYIILACIFQTAFTAIHNEACDILIGKEVRKERGAKRNVRKATRYKHPATRVG